MSRFVEVGTDQAPLAFRLRLAEDDQIPPIVMLHGLSGDENVMWSLESALPKSGLVVAPRAPHAVLQGGYAWNPTIKAWPPSISEFDEAIGLIEELFNYLEVNFDIASERMILMGFSNGTAMSFAASMKPMSRPPAGIIGISGHLPKGDLSPLRGIPVYWGHGTKDTFIPIDIARSDAERLRKEEVPVTFCEADVGHKLGVQCLKNLKSWLSTEFPVPEERDKQPT
ncbi:MAG: alpha/beta hydrolase [Anaerolineales bacterium]